MKSPITWPRVRTAGELIEEYARGRSRVLESSLQPVLPEKADQVHAAHGADRAALGQEVRRQEVADSATRAAFAAGVVPVELAVESQISARKVVVIHVSKAQIGVDAEHIVGAVLRV
jgi:hypothetical protein